MDLKIRSIILRQIIMLTGIIIIGALISHCGNTLKRNLDDNIVSISRTYNIILNYSYEKHKEEAAIKGKESMDEYTKEELEATYRVLKLRLLRDWVYNNIEINGLGIILFGCPLYIFIRSIFWAKRQLKNG